MKIERHGSSSRLSPSVFAAASYLLYFAALGLFAPYFPAYLSARGLGTVAIGGLLAAGPLMRVVFPPLVGLAADRRGTAGGVRLWSRIVAWGAIAGLLVIAWSANPLWLVAGTLLYYVFIAPAIPLLDTLAVRLAADRGTRFGRVRLWGSIGFLLTSGVFGLLSPQMPAATIIAGIIFAHLAFALFLLLPAPHADVAANNDFKDSAVVIRQSGVMSLPADALTERTGWRAAMKSVQQPALALLLATLFLNRLASAPFNGFYTIFVRELGLGAEVVAWSWTLAVGCEILVMLVVDRLIERFGFAPVLLCGCALEALRWFALASAETPAALLLIAPSHGVAFTMLYVASVRGLTRVVPEGLQTFGQAAGAAATGVGQTIGYILTGYLHDAAGNTGMFFVAGCIGVLTTVNAASLVWVLRAAALAGRGKSGAPITR